MAAQSEPMPLYLSPIYLPDMLHIKPFTFNPYAENTYVLSDASKACVIIDPGCYTPEERALLAGYIAAEGLTVTHLLNTHGHIDHMLGNAFVKDTYKVPFAAHKLAVPELEATQAYGSMMGIKPDISPEPDRLIAAGDVIQFGETSLDVWFTPGHSAGHVSFYHAASRQLFSGDVLFQGSIGRTDLPGGSFPVLMESIRDQFLPLPDEVIVYPGHGPETSIGAERQANPFILEYLLKG